MKITVLLLCALGVALAAADDNNNKQQADKEFLRKQNDLINLYTKLHQTSTVPEVNQEATNFNFQKQAENSNNPGAVKQFQNAYTQGLLPRNEVWNYNNPNHLQQAIHLFDVFYFAKDYNTFYQAASWARQNVNEDAFVYALSVAVLNRPDTQGIILLPQSDVNSNFYINAKAIQKAQNYKQEGQKQAHIPSNNTNNYAYNLQHYYQQDPQEYPFNSLNKNVNDNENYANQYQNQHQNNQEGRLSYYNEDINLNQQFAYEQLKNPTWFNSQKYNQNKQENQNQNNGENFYYYFQQALARYNLERYANGLPNVHPFRFNQNIQPGYNPQLQYSNGQPVTARPNKVNPNNANPNVLYQLKNIDRRIADVVDTHQAQAADGSKVQLNAENGVQVLGNIIQNNGDSTNNQYYGANNGLYGYLDQLRRLVGSTVNNDYNSDNDLPSAIEHDHSANRDPVFYQLVSRVVNFFQNFKNQLRPYNVDQLNFQGVKVQSVNTDKLITYFDNNEVSLYNAVNYHEKEEPQQFRYTAQQQQLNNKPFNYQIQVDSEKEADAIVRVFIGPKYDAQGQQNSLEQARQNFVEIDRFVEHLKNGQNTITRSSQQSTRFVSPPPKSLQTYRQVLHARKDGTPYFYNPNVAQEEAKFPQNLILPKGSRQGQEYVLAVAVNSVQGGQDDNRPQGFPFDRVVREANFQQAQNIHFQTVKIFNKNQDEIKVVV